MPFSVAHFVISGGYYRGSFEYVIESIVRLRLHNEAPDLTSHTVITEISGTRLERRRRASTPPSKQYTPYSPTNIALIYINKGLFYNSTLKL